MHIALIATFIPFCWLGMQAIHELGHVIGTLMTGGQVQRVVLLPWTLSRTDVSPNPNPGLVVWLGPIIGCAIPVLAAVATYRWQFEGFFLVRFFAGFCCIANGVYIAFGSFNSIGDCATMIDSGSPVWLLWFFGIIVIPAGFYFWYGLGPHFGIGSSARPVAAKFFWLSFTLLLAMVIVGLAVSR